MCLYQVPNIFLKKTDIVCNVVEHSLALHEALAAHCMKKDYL